MELQPAPVLAETLLHILREMKSVAVALSGGVDSAVVAKAAYLALGEQAVAVTSHSASVSRRDREDAATIAGQIGIRHVVIATQEFSNPDYLKNDARRCYHCKTELYDNLVAMRTQLKVDWIVSGANQDDLGDYRPGLIAAAEHDVRHPLQEARLGKVEVRVLARYWNLAVWDKPASPCLSSRVAPGIAVTAERLERIESGEKYLREELEISDCRIRVHENELARIEVPVDLLPKLTAQYLSVCEKLTALGFRYITLDLQGLRSGNLNQLLSLGTTKAANRTTS